MKINHFIYLFALFFLMGLNVAINVETPPPHTGWTRGTEYIDKTRAYTLDHGETMYFINEKDTASITLVSTTIIDVDGDTVFYQDKDSCITYWR